MDSVLSLFYYEREGLKKTEKAVRLTAWVDQKPQKSAMKSFGSKLNLHQNNRLSLLLVTSAVVITTLTNLKVTHADLFICFYVSPQY